MRWRFRRGNGRGSRPVSSRAPTKSEAVEAMAAGRRRGRWHSSATRRARRRRRRGVCTSLSTASPSAPSSQSSRRCAARRAVRRVQRHRRPARRAAVASSAPSAGKKLLRDAAGNTSAPSSDLGWRRRRGCCRRARARRTNWQSTRITIPARGRRRAHGKRGGDGDQSSHGSVPAATGFASPSTARGLEWALRV